MESLLSCNKARVVLAALKGVKKIDHNTLIRLVKQEGLKKHDDPFGTGRWCFFESEINAWFKARLAGDPPMPLRGPGRPLNSKNRAPANRQASGGSLTER